MSEVGKNGLEMSTCKCRENTNNMVMTRNFYNERVRDNILAGRKDAIEEVLELLEVHKNLWFSQSLTIGSGAFWANKAQTAQALITEIRKRHNV
jgi:L-lactate utilization protein LutB